MGAILAGIVMDGVIMDGDWFDQKHIDLMRHHVLLAVMPVFFLSTGLRTNWTVGERWYLSLLRCY